ncbi:MAG: beta-N-acetylhexosaminidase [Lentimicrobiaceae bacterium]|nr:beta-N-acetylhexosaminidase [Lentimicrobiaceae bacterium]
MKKLSLFVSFLFILSACSNIERNATKANLDIIPIPQKMEIMDNVFNLDNNTVVVSDDEKNQFNATHLQTYLKKLFKSDVLLLKEANDNYIRLNIIDSDKCDDIGLMNDNEAYILNITSHGIEITSVDAAGIFYGIQTLLQMLPNDIFAETSHAYDNIEFPNMRIVDNPRFKYRGLMLDCSRTFYDVEYIKHLLDALAHYKINNFHWHLADDQGWRIEIKQYPKLTELGAWRGADELLMPAYGSGNERNGGFYSQEEIKDIVKYAADRQINIIPEIDLPGHSKAVAVTYPEIVCDIDNVHLSVQGESNNVWCVGREDNYIMLENIIKEMTELFPSKVYHIGADEVNMNSWRDCELCQNLMKEKDMHQLVELQNYFVRRIEKILYKHGKTMAGWDEILDGGDLMESTIPYVWQNSSRGIKSVKAGQPTVMQVSQYMYFDMKQSADERGLKWAGIIPLDSVYSFDPIGNFVLTEEEQKLVLGPQAGLWTECGQMPYYADYQLFPKILVLSEIGWSAQEMRDLASFKKRLIDSHLDRLYQMDFKFRVAPPTVVYEDNKLIVNKEYDKLVIRYSDDKSAPTINSPEYTAAITTDKPENYRFATFYNERPSIARGAQNIDLYHFMKPRTTISSNVPMENDINSLVDYNLNTYCYTSRPVMAGDYFLYTFDEAVKCDKIWAATGHYGLAIVGLPNARIDYSYDGVNFMEGEDFVYDYFDGYKAACYPEKEVKAVRIVVTGIGECQYAILQDLRIE